MLNGRQFLTHPPISAASVRLALATGAMFVAFPAQAQLDADGAASQSVVQAVSNTDSMNLNEALTRLGRNPRDGQALIDAGQAALAIGDVEAAVGFFSRADQVSPGNAKVKAGLARALVHNGNPFDAIPLFEEAERIGPLDSNAALDRGLAYDLVADNVSAQRYYRQALTGGANDEATRRLAISLAISGDKRGTGSTLSPLLARQDMAAWRARAFSLAIMGQAEEAITVVNSTLPGALATGIAPYLRYMPRLTPAQQAAAANFGQFPRASEIGQDDPRVARFATTSSRRTALASADAGLIPKGEPLGRNNSRRGRDERRNLQANSDQQRATAAAPIAAAPTAPAPTAPARTSVAMAPGIPDPKVRRIYDTSGFPAYAPSATATASAPAPAAQPRPNTALASVPAPAARPAVPPAAARQVVAAPAATPIVQPLPAVRPAPAMTSVATPPSLAATPVPTPAPPLVTAPAPRPTVAAAPIARTQPSAPTPPVPPVPRRQSLSEAFSDLARPSADIAPAAGAVDIRRIRPTRQVAPGIAAEVPKAPSHPSRIWVQLATGRDKSALAYDWRRMARQAETLFKSRRPSVSAWGQTNRLLAGPFESEAAANSFLAQLRRGDITGAFVWTSPAGQVVDALPGR